MQFVFEAAIQCSLEDDLAQISNKMRGAPGFESAPNSGREDSLSSRIESTLSLYLCGFVSPPFF